MSPPATASWCSLGPVIEHAPCSVGPHCEGSQDEKMRNCTACKSTRAAVVEAGRVTTGMAPAWLGLALIACAHAASDAKPGAVVCTQRCVEAGRCCEGTIAACGKPSCAQVSDYLISIMFDPNVCTPRCIFTVRLSSMVLYFSNSE